MNKLLKFVLTSSLTLTLFSPVIPMSREDASEVRVKDWTTESYNMRVEATRTGEHTTSIVSIFKPEGEYFVISGDYKYEYNLTISCNDPVTLISGSSMYRAPDVITSTVYCRKGEVLSMDYEGGWIIIVSSGIVSKVSPGWNDLRYSEDEQ